MKIVIITTPLRDEPSRTPPWGPLSIMSWVQRYGDSDIDIEFYNIDAHRPKFDEVLEYFQKKSPDILAISAVVSTAYEYTKRITQGVKEILPNVKVVVGGNLCASAEVLLHKADVDVCVIGEGEKVFLNLVNHYKEEKSFDDLRNILGIAFLDKQKEMVNTGYEIALPADQVWDVDWTIIEKDNTVDIYFPIVPIKQLTGRTMPKGDKRFDKIKNKIQKHKLRLGVLACAKGCIARCTFCHRWDKGIRHIPVDKILERLDYIIERYNVAVVHMAAESFGASRKWLNEFLEKIKPYNLLWMAGGVRTSMVDPDIIQDMKDTGCYSLIYGNETGSAKMMEIMEKKVSMDDNYNAAKWTAEAGLAYIMQLVIGMPGETDETIRETIEYCKYASCLNADHDPRLISINYAQALPGTPLYEYARKKELLKKPGLEGEEEYLIDISDKDAADPITCINFTESSRLTFMSWNLLIRIEVRHHHQKKFGKKNYAQILTDDTTVSRLPEDIAKHIRLKGETDIILFLKLIFSGRFTILLACFPQFFYYTRFFVKLYTLLNVYRIYGLKIAIMILGNHIKYMMKRRKKWAYEYRSLRKIVRDEIDPMDNDIPEMEPLRKGR